MHAGLPEQEAALEKARAGEGRDVEHVALETKGTLQLAAAKSGAPPRRNAKRSRAPASKTGSLALLRRRPISVARAWPERENLQMLSWRALFMACVERWMHAQTLQQLQRSSQAARRSSLWRPAGS